MQEEAIAQKVREIVKVRRSVEEGAVGGEE